MVADPEDLIEGTAADYVQALRDIDSPLVATDELTAERADYARGIVSAVLRTLSGSADEKPTLDTRPLVVQLADNGVLPSVALSGAALLFEMALNRLNGALPARNTEISIHLARHLLFGIALVLDSIGFAFRREDLKIEIVDGSRLRATLSNREATIFMLLVDKENTNEIARKLDIRKTTVKHHITNIGHKLGGQGREQLIRRARELGILVAVPLSASAALTALNALAGS
jgi:DNA-binding CsgD family transcriptional regulator